MFVINFISVYYIDSSKDIESGNDIFKDYELNLLPMSAN